VVLDDPDVLKSKPEVKKVGLLSLLTPRERESMKRLKSKAVPTKTYKWNERHNKGKSLYEHK
jgi:hypothetical protein